MKGENIYSQLKPTWHLDRISALRAGRIPPPVHVHMILSDLCNQNCTFCNYRADEGLSFELFHTPETRNPNRKIPREKALEIIGDCSLMGVKAMHFTGGGEPTVHPNYLELMGYAQGWGIETAIVTNGVKLDVLAPEVQRLKWIRVSVDAGDAETYAAVRRVRHPGRGGNRRWRSRPMSRRRP